MAMMEWVAVDIETSGLDPHRHEVIEVGLVHRDGSTWAMSLPFDETKADPKALGINGWGFREFATMRDFDYLGQLLHKIFYHTNTMLVASPAHFDVGFLEALIRSHGETPPWGHRNIIDLKSYACARFGVLNDLKNSEISRMLNIEDTSDHTALGDAKWTARLFHGLTASNGLFS